MVCHPEYIQHTLSCMPRATAQQLIPENERECLCLATCRVLCAALQLTVLSGTLPAQVCSLQACHAKCCNTLKCAEFQT